MLPIGMVDRRVRNLIAAKTAEEIHNRLEFRSDWRDTTDA
jgi:hypothetical protein